MPNVEIDPEVIRAVVDSYKERLTEKSVESFLRYLDRNKLVVCDYTAGGHLRTVRDRIKLVTEFMRSEEWKS